MPNSRVREIHVEGLRTLADVSLGLDGLTVLIGDNGSGKSNLIEACELLRRAASEGFADDLQHIHGGMPALLRFGAPRLKLGLTIENDIYRMAYCFALQDDGSIESEQLELSVPGESDEPIDVLKRHGSVGSVLLNDSDRGFEKKFDSRRLALTAFGDFPPHHAMATMAEALRALDIHLPFDTMARWAQRSRGLSSPMRGAVTLEPADALSRFGNNLANAWNALKNDFSEAHWQESMDYVRLGLGRDVESINVRADPGGGTIALRLKYAGLDEQIPAFSLSDGTLAYLGFVALFRLNTNKSLIAFDEPETHLHPELLMRVLGLFETMARTRPVLLATHSDRLLDGLSEPARSVVLCELDERRATRLLRPDPKALQDWLSDYRGLGDIRSAGHAASVLTRPEGR